MSKLTPAQLLYNANTDKLKPTGQAQTDKLLAARLGLRAGG